MIIPKTKISRAKVELRNRILNFKSSEVGIAGGKLNIDLSSEIGEDFKKVFETQQKMDDVKTIGWCKNKVFGWC